MTHSTNLCIVLLATAAVLTGCKKKEDKPAPAAGSAAPAPAPPPSPPGIVVKDGSFKQVEGTYDVTKAVALTDPTHMEIVVPMNCGPDFGCGITTQWANSIDDQKFAAACPKGVALHVSLEDVSKAGDPLPGKHPASMYAVEGAGGQMSIGKGDVVEITEHTADSLSGKVTYAKDEYAANGTFKATICKMAK